MCDGPWAMLLRVQLRVIVPLMMHPEGTASGVLPECTLIALEAASGPGSGPRRVRPGPRRVLKTEAH
jgi:hypothetical protein